MDTQNSQANSLFKVATGLFKDARLAYSDYDGILLDLERFARIAKTRGLGFYTLDLPRFDELLVRGLETGVLDPTFGYKRRRKGSKVPLMLEGLWRRVFCDNGRLCDEPDSTAIAFLRQIFCLGKKVETRCSQPRLEAVVKEYYAIERDLRRPTAEWQSDELDFDALRDVHFRDGLDHHSAPLFDRETPESHRDARLAKLVERFDKVSRIIATSFGYFDPYAFTGYGVTEHRGIAHKHGTGAVSDLRSGANRFRFPHWSNKLQAVFPYDAHACYNAWAVAEREFVNHERPSKLIAVPKTARGPRLICSEPHALQWCQQAVWHYLHTTVRDSWLRSFIDFRNQGASQALVRRASRDMSLATIDLSSASDRLSCWCIERFWVSNPTVLRALHATRSRYLVDTISRERTYLGLRKFAVSGSALTFPVQSLFFLGVALACVASDAPTERELRTWKGVVRVFGDDIIVPNSVYADMVRLLQYLGLKPNEAKSFHLGHFRESCGLDAYKGDDVTPVKPRSVISYTPEGRASLVELSNNLFLKGFWHAAEAARSILPRAFRYGVRGPSSGQCGFTSFTGGWTAHLRRRWNVWLHREEVLALSLSAKVKRRKYSCTSGVFQYFTERPDPLTKWESGIPGRPKIREKLRWVPATGNQ